MKTAGYWISRHPSPDEIVMPPEEIQAFNAAIREQKLTRDIFKPETFLPNFSAAKTFGETARKLQSEKYFIELPLPPPRLPDGQISKRGGPRGRSKTAGSNFFEPLLQNMNTHETFAPQYGLIVHFTDERMLPTDDGLYESPGDVQFDQLQNSGLDIGTPILIVHRSQDQKWIYEINELTEGWIHVENVAVADKATVETFASSADFVVATIAKADLFSDSGRRTRLGSIRMGARLPLLELPLPPLSQRGGKSSRETIPPLYLKEGVRGSSSITVQYPSRNESGRLVLQSGFMNDDEIHKDYLPYNARTIYHQAFAMLNQPYGWGGYQGEQDCSRFLQEVFAVVGVRLPRNSKEQAQTGQPAAVFDDKTTDSQKREAFQTLADGIHILTLKGHIMLYLENVDGRPYAIHAIYAYRERGDIARVINRVAVTDLDIGEESKKGSLLRRLTGIRKIDDK